MRSREGEEWGTQQKKLASFSTVEDFWRVYNNILPASKLEANHMYHFFKVGGSEANGGVGGYQAFLGRRVERQRWLLGRARERGVRGVAFRNSPGGASV